MPTDIDAIRQLGLIKQGYSPNQASAMVLERLMQEYNSLNDAQKVIAKENYSRAMPTAGQKGTPSQGYSFAVPTFSAKVDTNVPVSDAARKALGGALLGLPSNPVPQAKKLLGNVSFAPEVYPINPLTKTPSNFSVRQMQEIAAKSNAEIVKEQEYKKLVDQLNASIDFGDIPQVKADSLISEKISPTLLAAQNRQVNDQIQPLKNNLRTFYDKNADLGKVDQAYRDALVSLERLRMPDDPKNRAEIRRIADNLYNEYGAIKSARKYIKPAIEKAFQLYGNDPSKILKDLKNDGEYFGKIGNLLGVKSEDIVFDLLSHRGYLDYYNKLTSKGQTLQQVVYGPKDSPDPRIPTELMGTYTAEMVGAINVFKGQLGEEVLRRAVRQRDELTKIKNYLESPEGKSLQNEQREALVNKHNGLINELNNKGTILEGLYANIDLQVSRKKDIKIDQALQREENWHKEQTNFDLAQKLDINDDWLPWDGQTAARSVLSFITFGNENKFGIGVSNIGRKVVNYFDWLSMEGMRKSILTGPSMLEVTDYGDGRPTTTRVKVSNVPTKEEYVKSVSNYINSYVYPTQDKIASTAAGRFISTSQFLYLDKESQLRMGNGFSMEMPTILAQQVPSLILTGGIMTGLGYAVKGVAALSTVNKAVQTTAKVARLNRLEAAVNGASSGAQVWRNYIAGEAAVQGTLAGKYLVKTFEASVPTMIGVYTTTYPSIYRQTLEELYANKVENAEEKAKIIARVRTGIEAFTEGLVPDINYFAASKKFADVAKSSYLGKLLDLVGADKVRNLNWYMRLASLSGLSPAAAGFIAKSQHLSKVFLKEAMTHGKVLSKIGFNFQEGFEEIVAEIGNHLADTHFANVTKIPPQPLDFESFLNAFAGGAFATGPMALPHIASYYKENHIQEAFKVALNPEQYKGYISQLLQQNKISEGEAVRIIAQVNQYAAIAESKQFRNLVDLTNYMEDRDAQYMYFRALLNLQGVEESIQGIDESKIKPEEKTRLLETAKEIQKDLKRYTTRASLYENMTDEEKEKKLIRHSERIAQRFPNYSLPQLRKLLQEQKEQREIAEINSRSTFSKIDKVISVHIERIENAINEKEAAVKKAAEEKNLNPLLVEIYNQNTSERVEEIPIEDVDVDSIHDVADMILQATLNPEGSTVLENLYEKSLALETAEQAEDELEQRFLQSKGVESFTDPALSSADIAEFDQLFKTHQDAVNQAKDELAALVEQFIAKFNPAIAQGKVDAEQIADLLFGRQGAVMRHNQAFFTSIRPLGVSEQLNFAEFQAVLAETAKERALYINEQLTKEAEAEAERRRAAYGPTSATRPSAQPSESQKERVAPRQIISISPELYSNLTDLTQEVQNDILRYIDAIDNNIRSEIRSAVPKILEYVFNAPDKDQAIARLKFLAAITMNQESIDRFIEMATNLLTYTSSVLNSPEEIKAFESMGVMASMLTMADKAMLSKYANVEEIPEEEPAPAETPEEAPVPTQPPTQTSPTSPEASTNIPDLTALGSQQLYLAAYNDIEYQDGKPFALRQESMLASIMRSRNQYKMRVMDLFSFMKAYYGESATARLKALEEVFQATKGSLTKDEETALREKFMQNYPVEIFGEENAEWNFNNLVSARTGGITELNTKPTVDEVLSLTEGKTIKWGENQVKVKTGKGTVKGRISLVNAKGEVIAQVTPSALATELKLPIYKKAKKFADMNFILSVAMNYDGQGNLQFANFNDQGSPDSSGKNLFTLSIPRNLNDAELQSAPMGNVLREIIYNEGAIDGIAEITSGVIRIQKKNKSVGFTIGLESAQQVVAEPQVQEAPVPAAPAQPSDIEAKKADIEKRRQEALKTPIEQITDPNDPFFEVGTWNLYGGEFQGKTKQEVIDKINAKYDAELAALEGTTPTEEKAERIDQFNRAKKGTLERIKNSNDPQVIFSEINKLQEGLKNTKGAELTPEEQSFIDGKLKELKDKGYTFRTKKGEILREGETVIVGENIRYLEPDEVTEEQRNLIEKELTRRKKLKQQLIDNGYTEEEATNQAGLNPKDNIKIVVRDVKVALLKDGVQEKAGEAATVFIDIKDAESVISKKAPQAKTKSEIEADLKAKKADIERRRQEELDTNTSAGYGVIASDYLFTGGRGSMLSTDYLLQALTASFPFAGKQIDAIRNKYASKLGNISDDVNTKSYNDAIAEIREAINTTYQNSEIESLFDEILNNSTGFISREGNRVSSRLEALNEEHQNKINAKYDAELDALKTQTEPSVEPTPQAPIAPPTAPEAPVSKVEEAPVPQVTPRNTLEFVKSKIEQLIKESASVPSPTDTAYTINGGKYLRQSLYKSPYAFEENDDTKAAVTVGDFVDSLGRDVLAGRQPKSKQEYLDEVRKKQNPDGTNKFYRDLEISDAVYNKMISDFQRFRTTILSSGGTIYTDTMVLHRKFAKKLQYKGESYDGVAGVIDILIVDSSGNAHIVDMKSMIFKGEPTNPIYLQNAFDAFNKAHRKPSYEDQQNIYEVLAKGLLPPIKSLNILSIHADYAIEENSVRVDYLGVVDMSLKMKNPNIPVVAALQKKVFFQTQKEADFEGRNDITFAITPDIQEPETKPPCNLL